MRADSHIVVARADVRGTELRRHAASKLRSGRAFAVSCGLGLPRTWAFATTRVLEGFSSAIETEPGSGAGLLESGLHAARTKLARGCETLIERMLPDATLTAVLVDNGTLHAMTAGPGRVYLHRARNPQRLTPRDDGREGILHAQPSRCHVTLDPGDVVLVGSLSAFTVRAVSQLAQVLDADPSTPVSVLASLLSEPAAQAGIGAAAIAIRIR